MKLKPLDRQVIVITGASSGIGLATALAAAEQGAKVALVARSATTLEEVVETIAAAGGEAIGLAADVATRERVEWVAGAAVARFGRIDTWVNDAGVGIYGLLEEIDEADARRLFDVNFWGVVHGSLVALPHLRSEGGALINVGSVLSEVVVPLQGIYAASKHAVKGFTDALRVEIEEVDGASVSITLIEPAGVDTPFPEHALVTMAKAPKLSSPRIDPERVAEAILDAAVRPARNVHVGAASKLAVLASKLIPSWTDKIAARQVDSQQEDGPPRDPEGTLYKAGNSGRIRGRGASAATGFERSEAARGDVRRRHED